MPFSRPYAALLIIGNEILSGRTQDKNLHWLAGQLNTLGIGIGEARIIPDIQDVIVETVNLCRAHYAYVFTTGGIGPTHDDITAASIAKAFGVPLSRHIEAEALLRDHYTAEQINEARMKMADIPEGAELIYNPVSAAPGFCIENVYVMAGIPSIMQAMFSGIKHTLSGGAQVQSLTVTVFASEGTIAGLLGTVQTQFPEIEIGSYPFIRFERLGTSVVMRSPNKTQLEEASQFLQLELKDAGLEDVTAGKIEQQAI